MCSDALASLQSKTLLQSKPYCCQNPYSLEPSPGGAYAGDYVNDPASEGPHWPTTRASPQASLARRSRGSPSNELALINVRAHKESKAKTHSDLALERSLQRLEVVQARLKEGPQVRSPEKCSPPRHMGGPWVVPPPQKEQFLEKLSPVVAKWAKTAGLREVTQKHIPSPLKDYEKRVEAENHYLEAPPKTPQLSP